MNKTERINLIMRYINNRAQFTISEIQNAFHISRATAIRDVQEIESLGFPLVSERGRGGGYFVLQNGYLPAVRFTPDELRAIFIAFLASKNSQLPFLGNRQSIAEKLIGIAPQAKQDELAALEHLLFFDNTNPYNPNIVDLSDAAPPILNQLLSQVVLDPNLEITYQKPGQTKAQVRKIFVSHVYNTGGHWYLDTYDYDQADGRNFRVDRIQAIQPLTTPYPYSPRAALEHIRKTTQKSNLSLKLSGSAISRFRRLHPFRTELAYTDPYQQTAWLDLHIDLRNARAMDYIADWLLFLGDGVQIKVIPDELAEILRQKLQSRLQDFDL